MSNPTINKIWLHKGVSYVPSSSDWELRFEWSNNYQHIFVVPFPYGKKEVAEILLRAAKLITKEVKADG